MKVHLETTHESTNYVVDIPRISQFGSTTVEFYNLKFHIDGEVNHSLK